MCVCVYVFVWSWGGGGSSLVGLSPWPVGSDTVSKQMVSEFHWIAGHPPGFREALGGVREGNTHAGIGAKIILPGHSVSLYGPPLWEGNDAEVFPLYFGFILKFIEVWLIYNVVLIPIVQQRASVMHIHIYMLWLFKSISVPRCKPSQAPIHNPFYLSLY